MEEQNESTTPKTPRPRCKNCDTKLSKQGSFCPGCGQRDFDGRIRMRDLLGKFFANFTHLDNKFVKMSWQLFVPALVTINYFQGKIKRYPHPVQFFFIVMFFFLLMFSKQFEDAGFNMTGGDMSIGGQDTYEMERGKKLLTESGLYEALQHCVIAKEHRSAFDSLPTAWKIPMVRQALDSVVGLVEGPWEAGTEYILSLSNSKDKESGSTMDTIRIKFTESVRIATVDLVNLTPDSIIQKYGFKDWDQKVTVRQGIKSLKDPKNLIHRYVGSLGWAILVLIAVMAFVLRLLYWKRGGYYVEHFIFLMHQQAGAFLLLTIAMVVNDYLFDLDWAWLLILGWVGISMLVAMKRFYDQSWGWTIAKWLVYCTVYVLGLIALFVGTLLVVFVIF